MWMSVNDQSETGVKPLLYRHIGQQITLIVYCKISNYCRVDDGNRCRPFFGLHLSEHT